MSAEIEKARVWQLIESDYGTTALVQNRRPDWRTVHDGTISLLMTFSNSRNLFYDVSKADLETFATFRHAYILFLAGSHTDVFVVPTQVLTDQIESVGLTPSQKYGDYKLHLSRNDIEAYFRELPELNLIPYHNCYSIH